MFIIYVIGTENRGLLFGPYHPENYKLRRMVMRPTECVWMIPGTE